MKARSLSLFKVLGSLTLCTILLIYSAWDSSSFILQSFNQCFTRLTSSYFTKPPNLVDMLRDFIVESTHRSRVRLQPFPLLRLFYIVSRIMRVYYFYSRKKAEFSNWLLQQGLHYFKLPHTSVLISLHSSQPPLAFSVGTCALYSSLKIPLVLDLVSLSHLPQPILDFSVAFQVELSQGFLVCTATKEPISSFGSRKLSQLLCLLNRQPLSGFIAVLNWGVISLFENSFLFSSLYTYYTSFLRKSQDIFYALLHLN